MEIYKVTNSESEFIYFKIVAYKDGNKYAKGICISCYMIGTIEYKIEVIDFEMEIDKSLLVEKIDLEEKLHMLVKVSLYIGKLLT